MSFGIKRTPADDWFSKCVRERAFWTCEKCGRGFTPPTQALGCSHFEGRANWGTRFVPENAISLCTGCHSRVESYRFEHEELHAKIFGPLMKDVIRELSQDIMHAKEIRRTKGKGEISKHYKNEYERMMELRAQGISGRLEFVGY